MLMLADCHCLRPSLDPVDLDLSKTDILGGRRRKALPLIQKNMDRLIYVRWLQTDGGINGDMWGLAFSDNCKNKSTKPLWRGQRKFIKTVFMYITSAEKIKPVDEIIKKFKVLARTRAYHSKPNLKKP